MQRERIAFPSWWWWFTEVSSPPSIPMILLLDGSTCQHVLPLMLVFEGGVGHTGRDKTGLHRDRGGRGVCVEEVKEELRGIERDPSIDALKIRDTFSRPNDAARPTDQPTRPLCNTSNVEDSFLLRGK